MLRLTLLALLALLSPFVHNVASACGGFQCSSLQPVVQDAEQIIFSDNGDGTVTAVIQIAYSGPAEEFAWVLPVPGIPEIGVSSNVAFQRLEAQTAPVYRIETTTEGECATRPAPPPTDPDRFADAAAGGDAGFPGPEVVDSGTVGPYDYVTISLEPGAENPGDVVVDFLVEGGYDVDDDAREILGSYLAMGMNIIAFRLTKNAMTGSIRPVVMTYTSARAMIPIRPTALAASSNMPVRVWVVGEHRAVPANYRHVVLNPTHFVRLAGSYRSVINEAIDEAGGRAFVTELAQPTATVAPSVIQSGEEAYVLPEEFEEVDDATLVRRAVMQFVVGSGGFGALTPHDGLSDVLQRHAPPPEGRAMNQYILDIARGASGPVVPEDFDRDAFAADMEVSVVAPLRMTQELLDRRPYMTRLFTTMSPDEMTEDPNFALNADLPNVSNEHVMTVVRHCSPAFYSNEAPRSSTIPGGLGVVRSQPSSWPHGDLPRALRIEQLGPSGAPEVIEDNTDSVRAAIRDQAREFSATPSDVPSMTARDDDGCSVGGSSAPWSLALIALALAFIRRRR